MRKKRTDQEIAGQDSFLDIVSNIVGILIILVMIAGVRAQNSMMNPVIPDSTSIQEEPINWADTETIQQIEAEIASYEKKAANTFSLRNAVTETLQQTEILDEQIEMQSHQRAALFELLISTRVDLDEMATKKNVSEQTKLEIQRQLQETDAKLDEMKKRKEWLQSTRPKATVLENIPTPISKTVENKESHFRLLGGKVTYVPLMELFEAMKIEVSKNQKDYMKQKSSQGKVGPLGDFVMEFMLVTYDVPMQNSFAAGMGTCLELDYAECLPVSDELGQTLNDALSSANSPFMQRLRLLRQDIVTITIWVYPDSFEEFRTLKQFLHSQGYKVAARPMEFNEPISGSPRGSKSSSQ
ncbi:MAG: hypothetical protein ACRCUY_07845 [Thermoguttaceae bacterium]